MDTPMTPPPSDQLGHILTAALDRDPAEREAFLAMACAGDAALLAEARALLAAHETMPTGFLAEPVVGGIAASAFDVTIKQDPRISQPAHAAIEREGDRIGPYKLREQIGEGGFGTVWVAEQEQPVRRRVALKIVKLGMDTRDVIARFEQERQALAMMDHPNIAKVLDAGATENGRPFFVMELVRGVKITEYCDEKQLSTAERIELFIAVCSAVQHAHQKGIIHRDLKPSNILVTFNDGVAVPKVIDFGVAKATQGRLAEHTIYTQFQQMIGTPLYMSPEQADMTSLDVDTRSDIYALGVLLYELLTGRTPIDEATMRKAGMDEMRRIIREVDPPRPSMRLKTLVGDELTSTAKRRHTEPAKLPGTLRGDLDWIVMKCLEKDRQRRYDTANGLALDLRRHLANEVIPARPPTASYLLGKLIRRNKLAFAASAAIAASLVVGIAASVWQAVRATHAEKRAVTALDELRASAPAFAEQAHGLAAREQYTDAIAKLDYAIKLRPDAAEYLVAKADLLQCQFKLADAAVVYREALRVKPGLARAEASAKLCDELLAAPLSDSGKLTRESLAKLHVAMQKQQRPAAELLPVARLLGEEKKLLVEYWLARFKDLPVSAEKPLKDRLTVREDGRLALDLSETKIADLSPLTGAPLGELNLSSCKDLVDLAPLRGLALVELNIAETDVKDLSPLREMQTLEKLTLTSSKVTDLSALGALRLTTLNFTKCAIRDLTPIRKMPLEEMNLRDTRVSDISPLIGMPIKSIDLSMAPVLDFSPLAQLPLEKCYMQHNRIGDLWVLRGRPLKELVLSGCVNARNYAVLAEIKTLELLVLPSEYRTLSAQDYEAIGALRHHPKLRQLGSGVMNNMGYTDIGSKDLFWKDWDREQTFVPALRQTGFRFSFWKGPNGNYGIGIENQPISDLSLFKGRPISYLHLSGCKVTDLAPLRGMPLCYLHIGGSRVTDLSPLRDTPIQDLWISGTPVTDLSPLRGLKLDSLILHGTPVGDLSPLVGMPLKRLDLAGCNNLTDVALLLEIPTLEELTVPRGARNIGLLRKLPNLKRLAYDINARTYDDSHPSYEADTNVADFWRDYDAHPWIGRMNDAAIKPRSLKQLRDGTWEVDFNGTAIQDLTPLRGAPISVLSLGRTAVSDLEPLRGMPLTHLKLSECAALTDLSPLQELKELTELTLPPMAKDFERLRTLPKLERISFKEDGKLDHRPDKTAAEFWKEYDAQAWLRALRAMDVMVKSVKQLRDGTWDLNLSEAKISDLSILKGAPISSLNLKKTAVTNLGPLHGLPLKKLILDDTAVTDLLPLQGMPIEELELRRIKITDLAALRGMPLKNLQVGDEAIADLEPLRGMALTSLGITKTKVTDLSPLQGMPLEYLGLNGTEVTDISVVRGMPLTKVRLQLCAQLTDLSPLAEAKGLTSLSLPPNPKDIEFLRAFSKLERLSFMESRSDSTTPDQTATEFWKEWDAKKK